jgi:subtilisin family serine protease
LDRLVTNVHTDTASKDFGRTGRGVVVGIVDTGLDLTHPDLLLANHHTRVAYYLDLTQSKPLGHHPDLEKAYGCTDKDANGDYVAPCAVYTASDINSLLDANAIDSLPRDAIGHGTHVASLAASNGLSTSPPKYVGIAPEADLVIVNASRQNQGDLQDGDIVLGTQFVFDIADNILHEPAVANLSLGGDAGAHDGTSDLEKELTKLVGPNQPGHAVIVAAGNSASLESNSGIYPAPLGIHTSIQVLPDGNKTRVPVVIDSSQNSSIKSQVLVWVQGRQGDNLSMGVDVGSSECIAPIGLNGFVDSRACGSATVSLINGNMDASLLSTGGGSDERPPIVMLAEGKFASPLTLNLTFTGSGTAFVWIQSTGGLVSGQCTYGACVPAATRERTVAIPASARDLIAVGATYNRTGWVDANGDDITLEDLGAANTVSVGDVPGFSAGGPNQFDDLKPDILAPGGLVAGAMAREVDPRKNTTVAGGMFDGSGVCPHNANDCFVVDDLHGVALGTSMAAPIVAGAVALLFETDPNLTQQDVRRYLQAGAQKIPGTVQTSAQEGAGLLDIDGVLKAQANQTLTSGVVNRVTSWLDVSTALTHPDDKWAIRGGLHLRNGTRQAITLDASRIRVALSPGHLLSPVELQGYGYYTFDFAADSGSGRQTLDVDIFVDNQRFFHDELYIGVDVPSARGEVVAGRSCSIAKAHTHSGLDFWGWCFALGLVGVARQRRRR